MEALAGVMGYIKHSDAQYVVMADCDIICNIDMRDLVSYHIEKQADITVAYQKKFVNGQTSKDVTVISNDDDGRVRDVMIAPATVGECNVSINIVVMSKNFLERIVDECMSRNLYSFDKDVLQARVSNLKIYGYEYGGYCARIDSIQDYYNANMEMLDTETRNSLFIPTKPIYTKVRDEVPAKYGLEAKVSNSLIADGCEIYGEVENSIIFRGVKIGKGTRISNSIIMQGTDIGANCQLNYCVTDKDVTVKNGRMLMGYLSYPVFISKGSVV